MSLYSDIRLKNKEKNSKNNKVYIRNQKFLNIVWAILFSIIIVADILYLIIENVIGVSSFTNIVMIIAIILEALSIGILIFYKFNTENIILKSIIVGIFAIPLIAYLPMLGYGDLGSILLFVFRIFLIAGLVLLLLNKNRETKSYHIKRFIGISFSAILIVIIFVLLINRKTRTISYSYDDNLGGYVVNNVLEGNSDVEIKDGTVKISDNSLLNAGKSITIPKSVKYVSENAFLDSEVEEIYLEAEEINLMVALNNSNVSKVYINSENVNILDIDKVDKNNNVKFIISKDFIDDYRNKDLNYSYLYVPKTEDNEYYVVLNGTNMPIQYLHFGEIFEKPSNVTINSSDEVKFIGWKYTYKNEIPKFPIVINDNVELTAIWNKVYTINFDYSDGDIVETESDYWKTYPKSMKVSEDTGNLVLPKLEKSGYRFDGWYDLYSSDNVFNSIESNNYSNMDLKAKFSKIYVLKYHENGGYIPDDKDIEYIDGDAVTPLEARRDGFNFLGWYDNPELDGNPITVVTDLSIDLYAKWELMAPEITLSSDIDKIYNGESSDISLVLDHPLINDSSFIVSYEWRQKGTDILKSRSSSCQFINAENNEYYCKVVISYKGSQIEIDSDYVSVNISKAEYEIEENFNEKTITYGFNGKQQYPKVSALTGMDGTTLDYSVSFTGDITNIGGTGTVTYKFSTDSENYNVPSDWKVYIVITQKELTVIYDNTQLNKVYDGNYWIPEFSLEGVVDGYPIDLNYSIESGNSIDAGAYKLLFSIDETGNYKLNDNSRELIYEILKADYDLSNIEYDNLTFEYDGTVHKPTPTNLPAGLSIKNITGLKKAVIDGEVTIELNNTNSNYNDPANLVVNITINKKTITASINGDNTFIYDGTSKNPEIVFSGIISNDDVTAIFNSNNVNAGTYTVSIELNGVDKDNYVLESSNISYVISKANYDLTNIEYDNLVFDYDGTVHKPTPTNLPTGLSIKNITGLKDAVVNGEVTIELNNTNSNYNDPANLVVNITINKKTITASIDGENTFVYNKLIQTPNVTFTGLVGNDDVEYVVSNPKKDAGNYTLEIAIDSNNYELDLVNSDLEYYIEKADFEIGYTFKDVTNFTYDGNGHHPELANKTNYYVEQKLVTIDYEEKTNAGEYNNVKVTFSVSDNNNYNDQYGYYHLVIEKREITLEFVSLNFTYTGDLIIPTINNVNNVIEGDKVVANVNNNNIINASEDGYLLDISLSGDDSSNYIISKDYYAYVYENQIEITGFTVVDYNGVYDGDSHTVSVENLPNGITAHFDRYETNVCSEIKVNITFTSENPNEGIITKAEGTITITKRPVTITFETTTDLIYNGQVQIPNYTLDGVVPNEIVNVTISEESINCGHYTNVAVSLDNNNYKIDATSLSYDIKPRPVDIQWSNTEIVYSRSILKPTAKVLDKEDGDELDLEITITANGIDCGTYNATAVISDSNYIIYSGETTEYTIIPKPVSIIWSNTTLEYNGQNQKPEGSVVTISGDTCDVIVNVTGEYKVPGNYTAIAVLSNNNYKISGNDYCNYVISKGKFIVNNDNNEKVPSLTEVTYNGQAQTITVLGDNIFANDGSVILNRIDGEYINAGNYTVDVIFYTNNEGDSYYEEYIISTSLVIYQKELEISYVNSELKFTNTPNVPEIILLNKESEDIVEVSIKNATDSVSIGEYDPEFIITGASKDNYKITKSYKYQIVKGDLDLSEIEITNKTFNYNGNYQYPTISNLPEGVSIDLDKTTGVLNVGDTEIEIFFKLSGQTAVNYEVPNSITIDGLTVNPKTVSINWTKTEFGYDGNSHLPEYEIIGLVNDDIVNIIFDNLGEINRGNYSITVSSLDNSNYYIEVTSCEYEIKEGSYDLSNVVINDKYYTYDGKQHKSIKIDDGELPNGVTVEFVYGDEAIYVGTHEVTIRFTKTDPNYGEIPDRLAYVIINPAVLTISWTNTTFEYDGLFHKPEVSITNGLITGEECTINVSGQAKNAGTYTATATSGNDNYVISINNTKQFTINKKSIDVEIASGASVGPNFTYNYDGKIHDDIIVTFDQSDLVLGDDLQIDVDTSEIGKVVGTYTYTLVASNSNYTFNTISGTITIKKLSIYNSDEMTAHDGTRTQEPYITAIINGEEVRLDSLGTDDDPIPYVYLNGAWGSEVTNLTTGTYWIYAKTDNDNPNVSIASWIRYEVKYYAINQIMWSYDGTFTTDEISFEVSGKKSATASLEINGENVTFESGLKLESGSGIITFTIDKDMTIYVYSTNGKKIKINDNSYDASNNVTTVLLTSGTYTISKGDGQANVYAIILI